MAKEKPRCTYCGQEIGLFDRTQLLLYGTNQFLCSECRARYDKGSEEEQNHFQERMLLSPYLTDAKLVQNNYQQAQERQRVKEAERQAEETRMRQLDDRRRATLQCCGQEMESKGTFQFQLGEYSFWGGHLDNLFAGSLELETYCCPLCGQFKFFDPSLKRKDQPYVPLSQQINERENQSNGDSK
jgi:hypothetical protein